MIHDERRERWADWLKLAGVDVVDADARAAAIAGPNFSNSGHAQLAAEQGAGVVLASAMLAAVALRDGRICKPFAQELPCRERWWAATRADRLSDPAAAALWKWLIAPGRFQAPGA